MAVGAAGIHIVNNVTVSTYMDLLLGGVDLAVTEVLGVYESRQTILQSGTHPDPLPRTATIVEMLPHLQIQAHSLRCHGLSLLSLSVRNKALTWCSACTISLPVVSTLLQNVR